MKLMDLYLLEKERIIEKMDIKSRQIRLKEVFFEEVFEKEEPVKLNSDRSHKSFTEKIDEVEFTK